MGLSTPCSLMLATKSASSAASSRTLASSSNVCGSRCSRVPAAATCALMSLSVTVVVFSLMVMVTFHRWGEWAVAARSFCLLALKIWAGIRAVECKGPGAKFFARAQRASKEICEPLGPERSGGRGLARSGPPAIIESQKANKLAPGPAGTRCSAAPQALPPGQLPDGIGAGRSSRGRRARYSCMAVPFGIVGDGVVWPARGGPDHPGS